jgi:hypothetical protein
VRLNGFKSSVLWGLSSFRGFSASIQMTKTVLIWTISPVRGYLAGVAIYRKHYCGRHWAREHEHQTSATKNVFPSFFSSKMSSSTIFTQSPCSQQAAPEPAAPRSVPPRGSTGPGQCGGGNAAEGRRLLPGRGATRGERVSDERIEKIGGRSPP